MSLRSRIAWKHELAQKVNQPTYEPLSKGLVIKVYPNKVLELYRTFSRPSDTEVKTCATHGDIEDYSVVWKKDHAFIIPDSVKDFQV
jgi:hypothetical protein